LPPADQTFEACQIVATVLCSVAVLFFTVAFFRPYDAERGSSKSLGVVGGVFMSLFAFFQMVSFLLQDKSIRECELKSFAPNLGCACPKRCRGALSFERGGQKENGDYFMLFLHRWRWCYCWEVEVGDLGPEALRQRQPGQER